MTLSQKLKTQSLPEYIPYNTPPQGEVFTPLAPDGYTRLRFSVGVVKFLKGYRPGHAGVVEIQGEPYRVVSADCGLGCRCDARIVGRVPDGAWLESGEVETDVERMRRS